MKLSDTEETLAMILFIHLKATKYIIPKPTSEV